PLAPRPRHSFPTRRSSDLFTLPFAFNEAESSSVTAFTYATNNFNGIYYKDTVDVNAPTLVDPLNIGFASVGVFNAMPTPMSCFKDRKSTRLNSSHVKSRMP